MNKITRKKTSSVGETGLPSFFFFFSDLSFLVGRFPVHSAVPIFSICSSHHESGHFVSPGAKCFCRSETFAEMYEV